LVNVDNIIASKTKVTSTGICPLTTSNVEVVEKSDIIIIAVKPGVIATVLAEINTSFDAAQLKGKCFISIAAGVSTEDLSSKMPNHSGTSFIRVMPNTPCSVGECAAAYTLGAYASPADKDICEAIFKSVGTISQVPEPMMDGVTGLSGSGPACKGGFFLSPEKSFPF
jgi:pyrroline-5-carboxylate reductase